jgi:hypothetical protein
LNQGRYRYDDEIAARRRIDRAANLARRRPAGSTGTPTRIRGTIEKLDGQALTVKSREGQTATIALADNVAVAYLVKKNVGDIKPGDYIASTGIKGTDGKLHAIEVRIFPESLRGAGEGQYPWDLKPDSVMTNATVGTITQAPQGNVIKVSYKGTESEYTVDPTTPIFDAQDPEQHCTGVAGLLRDQRADDERNRTTRHNGVSVGSAWTWLSGGTSVTSVSEYTFDRLLVAKLEQVYRTLVPDRVRLSASLPRRSPGAAS